jgi:hypothetical protein
MEERGEKTRLSINGALPTMRSSKPGDNRTRQSGLRMVFLIKMCDLQTFTNFSFPATISREHYDLLAESSLKSRCWTHFQCIKRAPTPRGSLITPRSLYA